MNFENERRNTTDICETDFHAPPLRVLRSVLFNKELAQFYDGLGLSGPATIDWLETELFDHHNGQLFGPDCNPMAVKDDPFLTDNLWGEDERRTVLRLRERASKEFKNRLQTRMVQTVTLLHFGREIYLCRTLGNRKSN